MNGPPGCANLLAFSLSQTSFAKKVNGNRHQKACQRALMSVFCSPADTVGESFELNVAAAQEAGTLIKTARPIILAQGSVWEIWNYSYSRTTHAGSIFPACPASICLK